MLPVRGGQQPALDARLQAARSQAEGLSGTEAQLLFVGSGEIVIGMGSVMFSFAVCPSPVCNSGWIHFHRSID